MDDDDDFEEEEIEEENNAKEKERDIELHQQMCLTPVDTRRHLQDVWKTDGKVIKCLMGVFDLKGLSQECPTDIFFIDVLPVVPSRFRPVSFSVFLVKSNSSNAQLVFDHFQFDVIALFHQLNYIFFFSCDIFLVCKDEWIINGESSNA